MLSVVESALSIPGAGCGFIAAAAGVPEYASALETEGAGLGPGTCGAKAVAAAEDAAAAKGGAAVGAKFGAGEAAAGTIDKAAAAGAEAEAAVGL